jgi:hypothetical protein
MKKYEELIVEIVLVSEEVVRCSNTFDVGDDTKEDIFG